jgi:hypothetical protein
MNKKKIIAMVKSQEEEKVPFSLKLPVSLKAQIQALSESESISMNSLIVTTLQSLINDDCGIEIESLNAKLELAHEIIEYFEDVIVLTKEEIAEWSNRSGLTVPMMEQSNQFLKERIKLNADIAKFLNKEQK